MHRMDGVFALGMFTGATSQPDQKYELTTVAELAFR